MSICYYRKLGILSYALHLSLLLPILLAPLPLRSETTRNNPQDCDNLFSQAQYDAEGLGKGLQRYFVDRNKRVFIVYPSAVLSIQPKCIFYEAKIGEFINFNSPVGKLRLKYVLRKGYLERNECIIGYGCQNSRFPIR